MKPTHCEKLDFIVVFCGKRTWLSSLKKGKILSSSCFWCSQISTSLFANCMDDWRDHALSKPVTFLSENKQQIHARYLEQRQGQLPRDLIEQEGLMDFELALTFLEDKPKGFGLGLGFFKANLIR